MIGLYYAMPGEIASMLEKTGAPEEQCVSGCHFYRIDENIIACAGGVGKVNAAMATQLMISLYHPDLIVNAGVAGSFEILPIGTIVLAEKFIQHDVDTTAVGDPIGLVSTVNQVEFPTAELSKAKSVLDTMNIDYKVGTVASGDWFATHTERSQWIADTFHPLLCEMEGCAVAQVCLRNNVPFMALKSVSDCLLSGVSSYFDFMQAMKDLNEVVFEFIHRI